MSNTASAFMVEITLHHRRCAECGRWWASETALAGECPICGDNKVMAARAEVARLERRLAATRGAFKRRRKRRA